MRRAAACLALPLVSGALPMPTTPQLKWQQGEIMALIHFNMATFFEDGDPGCNAGNWPGPTGSGNPASFNPTALNVSQWVDSMVAIHATEAVLTAKHGCGFLLWPTNVTLPDGSPYTYHAGVDVLTQFVAATSARGIGHGFYYSLTNNFFLNVLHHYVQNGTLLPGQANVTQSQFEQIALGHVTELWTRFGNLTEIWFDGGYTTDMQTQLQALLAGAQPQAVGFGGQGICNNPARWCGTEGGDPPGWPTIYSTSCPDAGYGPGCRPDSPGAIWNPSGVDFTLQQGDHWFWTPGDAIHPLTDLIDVYHKSVGANGKLELDFAIDRTGQVHPTHVAAYAAFGAWMDSCYGTPVATTSLPPGATVVVLTLPTATLVDRVMLREDQSFGQLIMNYTVEVQVAGTWQPFSSGLSIGNKRIDVAPSAVSATAFRFTALETLATPHLSVFSAFEAAPCTPPQTRVQFIYNYPNGTTGCLMSNTSFPCPGGAGNSCPLVVGNCSDPTAVWNDAGGVLASAAPQFNGNAGVNIDCNYEKPGTVAKLLAAGGWNSIQFSNGQLQWQTGDNANLCLTAGQGPVNPPCDPSEFYVSNEVTVDSCNLPTTQGWTRVPAATA